MRESRSLFPALEQVMRDLEIERGWCINGGKPRQMDLSMHVTQDSINSALRHLESAVRRGQLQVTEARAYRREHPPTYGTSE